MKKKQALPGFWVVVAGENTTFHFSSFSAREASEAACMAYSAALRRCGFSHSLAEKEADEQVSIAQTANSPGCGGRGCSSVVK